MDHDPDDRWLVMRRGSLAVSVNFSPESLTLPIPLGVVLLASDENMSETPEGARLPGQSLVIHRPET